MKKQLLKWITKVLCIAVSALCVLSASAFSNGSTFRQATAQNLCAASSQAQRTIKVAWPFQAGLSQTDANGIHSGYSYDYLMRIKQIANWDYEFFAGANDDEFLYEMITKLKTGEIDIIGGFNKSAEAEAMFSFPNYSYGTSYTTLSVAEENNRYENLNDFMTGKARIAVISTASSRIEALKKYCAENGIDYELIECASVEEMRGKLKDGQADALCLADLTLPDGLRIVAKFTGKPYYFITTKGNTDVVQSLNSALSQIAFDTPYFEEEIYQKHFDKNSKKLILSNEEKAYIAAADKIPVAVDPFNAPFQFVDSDGTMRGISLDILSEITKRTGLEFEYKTAVSMEEFSELLRNREAELTVGIPYNYAFADRLEVLLTTPFLYAPLMFVANQSTVNKPHAAASVAVTPYAVIEDLGEFKQILYFDTIKQCIDAVENGKADFAYGNSYGMQFYGFQKNYKNIVSLPVLDRTIGYGIAVSRDADMNLASIVSKSVRSLSDGDISNIIIKNSIMSATKPTLRDLMGIYPLESVLLVSSGLVGVIAVLIVLIFTRMRANRRLALENAKHEQLSALSGEYFYEYDIQKDRMSFSEAFRNLFDRPKVVENFAANVGDLSKQKLFEDGEKLLRVGDGTDRWFRVYGSTVEDEGKPAYFIGKLVDIQGEKEEKETLLKKSERDALTGLKNIEFFKTQVVEYLTKKSNEKCAFLIFDIDRFKSINDNFGHIEGDRVLREFSTLLTDVFGDNPYVARLGGDEFVVFLETFEENTVVEICTAIRLALRKIALGGDRLTVSGGVCTSAECRIYDDLYRKADKALYGVKGKGGDGYEIVSI